VKIDSTESPGPKARRLRVRSLVSIIVLAILEVMFVLITIGLWTTPFAPYSSSVLTASAQYTKSPTHENREHYLRELDGMRKTVLLARYACVIVVVANGSALACIYKWGRISST
jgi:hypothetical protein